MLLAERMRPTALNPEFLVGKASKIWHRELLHWQKQHFHLILWGAPGSGKTTLIRMLADQTQLPSVQLSAVRDGVREIRAAVQQCCGGLVFIDEIHRLNKSQQDSLLPVLEQAEAWILGATTENPSVSLNPAVLSRLRAIHLSPPSSDDIRTALLRGITFLLAEYDDKADFPQEKLTRLHALCAEKIPALSQGDVRFALNLLESLFQSSNVEDEEEIMQNSLRSFTSKEHYDWVSAMIKCLRGSDPDAALYYAFMALDAGEDPLFLMRRCIIFASEDVGNADPQALTLATSAHRAIECVGMPEGRIPLAQCITYLAATVKSNRAYKAIDKVRSWREEDALKPDAEHGPPAAITRKGAAEYRYPHDFPDSFVRMEYLPKDVAKLRHRDGPAYLPSEFGAEARIRARLQQLWSPRKEK